MSRLSPGHLALAAALFASVAAILAFTGLAAAHGNPEITASPNPATAGSVITVEGTDFEEEEELSLVLEGISGDLALGMAMTDAEGNFHIEVALPDSAGPGSYRIRAESSDATAIFEFRIITAADGAPASEEHEASIGFHRGGPATEVIALSVVLAVFAAAGAGLLFLRERSF